MGKVNKFYPAEPVFLTSALLLEVGLGHLRRSTELYRLHHRASYRKPGPDVADETTETGEAKETT
ncbi:hypothetical protein PHISCL_05964 [Aspergillus sclerotialis]|uniref:Uncharacterized protein n=1 Tax=Aspergillus sclerotialis TaxID=2070753 RepID=A0A3A2ZUM4_9EURO|nr:hypothetical protein PHISCL_05964 [Aspergillus sclerotialis]